MSAAPESVRAAHLRVITRDDISLVHPAGLDEMEARMRRLVGDGDHASAMGQEHIASGGKRLRGRLALAAAAALGAGRRDAVAWAAAVELLHNATLIHDDIQDGDTTRRGAPTLWTTHGRAQAINAGDMMLMLPFVAIAETAPAVRGELSRILAEHALATVRGQVAELDMLPRGTLDEDSYRRAIGGKTGALIALPVRGAALLAGRSERQARALGRAFLSLGMLFQLQDDVLDLYGDKGRDVVGSDLYEGKISALVVAHLARHPADRDGLLALLRAPRAETCPRAVHDAIEAFRRSGALAAVMETIDALAAQTERDPALAREPALRRLASDLVRLATAPIAHLSGGAS